jgi:hypothetical protein
VPFSYQAVDLAGIIPAPGVSRGEEPGRSAASTPLRAPSGLALAGQGLTRPPVRAGGVTWDRFHDPDAKHRRSHVAIVPVPGWNLSLIFETNPHGYPHCGLSG